MTLIKAFFLLTIFLKISCLLDHTSNHSTIQYKSLIAKIVLNQFQKDSETAISEEYAKQKEKN